MVGRTPCASGANPIERPIDALQMSLRNAGSRLAMFCLVMLASAMILAASVSAEDLQRRGPILVSGAYAWVASRAAKSGAVYMSILNEAAKDDRLVSASTRAARRSELHSTSETDDGIVRMQPLPEGIALPSRQPVALERGGLHLMLMGLKQSLAHGDEIALTLEFEEAGILEFVVSVDLER